MLPESAYESRFGPETTHESTFPCTLQEMVVESPGRTRFGDAVMETVGSVTVIVAASHALFPFVSAQVSVYEVVWSGVTVTLPPVLFGETGPTPLSIEAVFAPLH